MGVFKPLKEGVAPLTVVVLAAAAGLLIAQWDEPTDLIAARCGSTTWRSRSR